MADTKTECDWSVYILKCSDNTYYTGITNDIERRLKMHNDGKAAKYTRSRRPVKLAYMEGDMTRADAMAREREIKKLSKDQKKKLVR